MPLPSCCYAQVIKTVRRRRLVGVTHRVVFGTLEAVQQVLAACGWQINTAFVERVNLTIRQHVAAIGRRVTTLCKGEDGLRQQLALYPDVLQLLLASRQLTPPSAPAPEPTNGTGSAKRWQPAYASHGRWTDGSRLDTARGACCFACRRGHSQRGGEHAEGWEAARGGSLRRTTPRGTRRDCHAVL